MVLRLLSCLYSVVCIVLWLLLCLYCRVFNVVRLMPAFIVSALLLFGRFGAVIVRTAIFRTVIVIPLLSCR